MVGRQIAKETIIAADIFGGELIGRHLDFDSRAGCKSVKVRSLPSEPQVLNEKMFKM